MANAITFEELEGGFGLATLNVADAKVNTLGRRILGELAELVGRLESRSDLRGLLFRSGKPGQFIAGADLKELGALAFAPKEQASKGLALGHELFGKVSKLPFPTVALIDGTCLGGGTELVLAMDERIASKSHETKIGLPEVKVGLIPGWGGTQRLPRLVGLHAIEMITSGEPVSAERAAAIGLVFDAVPVENLIDEGKRVVEILRHDDMWKHQRERRSQPLGLSMDQMMFAFGAAEGVVREKTKGRYPAPLAALAAMRNGINLPLAEGIKAEREAANEVVGTPISANLISVFFMNSRLSRDPGVDNPEVKPRPIRRVGVIGAGLMGAGVAAAFARGGIPVALVDVDESRLADGLRRASEVVAGRIKIGRATPEDLAQMLALMNTSTNMNLFAECDLVVEAITENEKAKSETFRKLAEVLPAGAIVASNTSTISITRMGNFAPSAARFIGMHFFNPVDRMALVEVIRGEQTDDETVATIVALAKKIKKTPIVVRDCPGFLVNRVLFPYMNDALQLLGEGVSMDAIDRAATNFGMPMGPITLHDVVGLDTAFFAGKVLAAAFPDRSAETPILQEFVLAGRLGQKTGSGFRKHAGKKGKPEADPEAEALISKHIKKRPEPSESEIVDRMFLPMLLEATRVLEEKIVRDPADVDMGLILGIGFPPFRGGILRYCDQEGAAAIVARLAKFADLGKRYEPTQSLKTLAESGGRFYPTPKLGDAFGG